MGKQKEIEKRKRRNLNLCELYDFCKENNIEMYEINEYQVRLNNKLDIYPTNKKYCVFNKEDYTRNIWGAYSDLKEIIKFII